MQSKIEYQPSLVNNTPENEVELSEQPKSLISIMKLKQPVNFMRFILSQPVDRQRSREQSRIVTPITQAFCRTTSNFDTGSRIERKRSEYCTNQTQYFH